MLKEYSYCILSMDFRAKLFAIYRKGIHLKTLTTLIRYKETEGQRWKQRAGFILSRVVCELKVYNSSHKKICKLWHLHLASLYTLNSNHMQPLLKAISGFFLKPLRTIYAKYIVFILIFCISGGGGGSSIYQIKKMRGGGGAVFF